MMAIWHASWPFAVLAHKRLAHSVWPFLRESPVAALCDRDCFGGFPLEYPFSVVAVDVGGTKIACAVVRYENADAAPIILSKCSVPTDAQQGGEVVLARILDLVDGVRAEALSHGETIVGVGVATAGRVDVNTGNIAFANEIMPGWSGQPLGDALRERFECPSAVLGDVQSHALGEARWGAARGAQTAVVMAPGTGLGGGIICHGKIVRGKHGFAGEIGSTMNTLDALDGNLESVAAGSGIEARYYAACGVHQTGAEISHRAQLGEDIARQTIENAGRALGLALAGWTNIFDPDIAVVSGSVTKAGPIWRDAMVSAFKERTPGVLADLPIVDASLGDNAPLIGAAENLLDTLKN